MQEKITNVVIKKVVPIYGRIFKEPSFTLQNIERISSDLATQEERNEYYNCGVVAFKLTGVAFIIPLVLISIISIGILGGYNIFLPVLISIFCMLLSIGLTFELLQFKNKKSIQYYTKKELIKGIIIGVCSSVFFSYMLYVGLQ